MSETPNGTALPGVIVALAGWLVPGAGYFLIGHRSRALIVFVCIVTLYVLGLLVAGVRVVEVPGYGTHGYRRQTVAVTHASRGIIEYRTVDPTSIAEQDDPTLLAPGRPMGWALWQRLMSELASKPWFIAQILAGPLALCSAALSNLAAQHGVARVHAPLETIGTLYTAIAGMLNLYIIIDAAHRAGPTENA